MPRLRDECRANSASQFGANRNVLQVRIRRRQPPRRRSRLPEGCVQASARGIDQRRQSVHVRRLQLRKLPVVEHHARDGIILRQLLEHIDSRRYRSSLAVFHRLGQVHAIEQNVAQLLRRADIEFHPRDFVNLLRLSTQSRAPVRSTSARAPPYRFSLRPAPCAPAPERAAGPFPRKAWPAPPAPLRCATRPPAVR